MLCIRKSWQVFFISCNFIFSPYECPGHWMCACTVVRNYQIDSGVMKNNESLQSEITCIPKNNTITDMVDKNIPVFSHLYFVISHIYNQFIFAGVLQTLTFIKSIFIFKMFGNFPKNKEGYSLLKNEGVKTTTYGSMHSNE